MEYMWKMIIRSRKPFGGKDISSKVLGELILLKNKVVIVQDLSVLVLGGVLVLVLQRFWRRILRESLAVLTKK